MTVEEKLLPSKPDWVRSRVAWIATEDSGDHPTTCAEKLPELSGKTPALKNVTCATGGASVDKMQGGADWKKRYDAKFPGQFQIYSPYAYDAAMVLADAMKRANSVDPKVYTPELAKANFKGVTSTIAFEPNGEMKNPAITLYVYKDGKKTPL